MSSQPLKEVEARTGARLLGVAIAVLAVAILFGFFGEAIVASLRGRLPRSERAASLLRGALRLYAAGWSGLATYLVWIALSARRSATSVDLSVAPLADRGPRTEVRVWIGAFGLVVVALALALGQGSGLNYDEVLEVERSVAPPWPAVWIGSLDTSNHIAANALAKLAALIVDTEKSALRWPAVLTFAIGVGATYLVVARRAGLVAGLLAGGALATHGALFEHASSIRGYTVLWVAVLVLVVESESPERHGVWRSVFVVLVAVGAGLSHLLGMMWVGGLAVLEGARLSLGTGFRKRGSSRSVAYAVALGVSWVGWGPTIPSVFYGVGSAKTSDLTDVLLKAASGSDGGYWVAAALLLFGCLLLPPDRAMRHSVWLLGLGIPLAMAYVARLLGAAYFEPRFLTASVPVLVLGCSLGLHAQLQRGAALLCQLAVLLAVLPGGLESSVDRPNWIAAGSQASVSLRSCRAGSPVVVVAGRDETVVATAALRARCPGLTTLPGSAEVGTVPENASVVSIDSPVSFDAVRAVGCDSGLPFRRFSTGRGQSELIVWKRCRNAARSEGKALFREETG